MSATQQVTTLSKKYQLAIASLITLVFTCAYIIISSQIFTYIESELKHDIKDRALLVAKRATNYITDGNFNDFKSVLEQLSSLPRFNYVHVYHFDGDNLDFFSSYNKQGFPAIPDKRAVIENYQEPRISNNIIEYIHPIILDNNLLGYTYLQLDIDGYYQLKNNTLIMALSSYLIFIILGYLTARFLHKSLLRPLNKIILMAREISHKRDYTQRFASLNTLEFEVLAKNLNIMLNRTEKYIEKQGNAEQEILKLNQELESKVNQRTEALKESNQELLSTLEKLHQFQGQLVENEKMASLGDMVAGVAHEVNTPIGLGVTASTLLEDRLNEIKLAFEDKTLRSSQLKRFLSEGQENVSIIHRNLVRAADLISSFKKVAVDQSTEEDRAFYVNELLDEVLITLAPQLKLKTIHMDISCPEHLHVISKPGPINQILINLIVNSIIHGFENRQEGVITISVISLSGQLHLNYQDNGKGVEKSLKNKIFDPFITTKRGEGGSGLGLHLVYNLVTQALGGHIQFTSELDQGVQFEINFPVIMEEGPEQSLVEQES
ncbi:sensor histidine kinase [Colwellia sp. MEBiC06753]